MTAVKNVDTAHEGDEDGFLKDFHQWDEDFAIETARKCGIFAEGVDYPGKMLSQVIVVSPGLPQYNLERELLKGYYQEFYEHGFGYAYLIPGLTRVVQAAGRLLRSDDDRGVIIVMGRRFLDPRYMRLLPEEWTFGDPEALIHEDPAAAIREFFEDDERFAP